MENKDNLVEVVTNFGDTVYVDYDEWFKSNSHSIWGRETKESESGWYFIRSNLKEKES